VTTSISLSGILHATLLLASGAAGVLAFAPVGWYPLGVAALAVLFHYWLSDTPRRAFLHGGLFGIDSHDGSGDA